MMLWYISRMEPKDPSRIPYNAMDKYATMHHFVYDGNVHTCANLCYKMVHCGIRDWCLVGFVPQVLLIVDRSIRNISGLGHHTCYKILYHRCWCAASWYRQAINGFFVWHAHITNILSCDKIEILKCVYVVRNLIRWGYLIVAYWCHEDHGQHWLR